MDEAMNVNPLLPIDRQGFGDTLRNILYPAVIFSAIAIVWAIGWATSVTAKANGLLSSANANPSVGLGVYSPSVSDAEHTFVSAADDGD